VNFPCSYLKISTELPSYEIVIPVIFNTVAVALKDGPSEELLKAWDKVLILLDCSLLAGSFVEGFAEAGGSGWPF